MSKKLKTYLSFVYLLSVFVIIQLFSNYYTDFIFFEFLFFTFVLFSIHNLSSFINYQADSYSSIDLPILLPAIIFLGPFWATVSFIIGTIYYDRIINFVWYKFLFNRSMFLIASALSGIVFVGISQSISDPYYIISFFAATLTYFIANQMIFFYVIRLSETHRTHKATTYLLQTSKTAISEYIMALIFYHGMVSFGRVFLLIAIVFIYLIRDFMHTYIKQANTITQVIESFLKVIDSKDNYTEGHCQRVAEYCAILCEQAEVSRLKTDKIVNMAKIHDIGKIKVPDKILKSSSSLTEEEYREMQNHSKYGYEILNDIEIFQDDLDIIRHHHERYDGTGYPEGLSGKDIPLGARVISVCDAFDVMTTGRKYKPALTKEQTVQEIKDCSGTQFDPELAGHLVELIREGVFEEEFQAEAQQLQQPVRRSQRYGQAEIRNGG